MPKIKETLRSIYFHKIDRKIINFSAGLLDEITNYRSGFAGRQVNKASPGKIKL